MMRKDIEHSINGLDKHLREALLLTTTHTHAKTAAILGIKEGTLRTYVHEAKRRVAEDLLGSDEWHDAEIKSALAMYVDAIAIRMQKERESVWRKVTSWVWADDDSTSLRPAWVFSGALGALFLAGYFGAELRDLVGGARRDAQDGVVASVAPSGAESGGGDRARTDVMASDRDVGAGAELGKGGGFDDAVMSYAGFSLAGSGTDAGTGTERVLARSGSSEAAFRVGVAGESSVHRDFRAVQQRIQAGNRRTLTLSNMRMDVENRAQEIERACVENGWIFGQGMSTADVESAVEYVHRRRQELEDERMTLERQREEIEDVNDELEENRKRIETAFPIKGRDYEREFRRYMRDLEVRYVDALEQHYNARYLQYLTKLRDEYYAWFEGCAGTDLLDGLTITPG